MQVNNTDNMREKDKDRKCDEKRVAPWWNLQIKTGDDWSKKPKTQDSHPSAEMKIG